MKKIILYCLLIYHVSHLHAQTDSSDFKTQWHDLFSNFNPPTGYLWDKALPDSSVWFYKGGINDSIAEYTHWSNTYEYWNNASHNPNNSNLAYDSVRHKMNAYFKRGIAVVPLLHIRADRIRESAIDSGRVTLDTISGLLVVNGSGGVLENARTFIAAPFFSTFYDSIAHLYFSNDFNYGNSGTRIVAIRIRMNNGSWVNVTMDVQTNISFTQMGTNNLTIEYTLDNNEVYYSQASLLYSDPKNNAPNFLTLPSPFHFGNSVGDIYATPLRTTELGEPLGAFIDCVPGRSNGIWNVNITKPIIFVEGIDFGYEDHPTGCYGGKCGSLGLRDLLDGKLYHPYEKKEKKWYEEWDPIKKAPQLIAELQKKGYDIIYLDFHNGAEFIENNAMLLVELIKQVNYKKIGNEEIVVMGASMGGQVARYALSYMEKNNIPHCTRTYLSFDSPHRGANIPMGMQYQVAYFKGLLPGVMDVYKRKLDRAATKQLLVYHCANPSTNAGPDGWRPAFVNALNSVGNYPAFTRNISLVNGSVTAGNQGYEAGAKLLSMNPYGSKLFSKALRITSKVYACYYTREKIEFPPLKKTKEYLVQESQFMIKGVSASMVNPSIRPYDHVPGGMRDDLKKSEKIYGVFNVISHHDASCFIPTTSGLDINTTDLFYDATKNISRTRPVPSQYPFHTYYGPQGGNEQHSTISDNNIKWILEELEKNRVELPATLNKTYNYGQYERFLFRGTSIVSGGKLQFNGNYKTGFGNGPYDQVPVQGSLFESFTTDCGSVTTIESGGQMIVGDFNTQKNKAIVHFRKGSTLVIKTGGILRIQDQSQLIIEEGAKLVFYPGARILLEGENALLQLDGTLRLEANAVFSIEKGGAPTTGLIRYRNAGIGKGSAKIEVVGNNTAIRLEGTGKMSDPLLEVQGEMILPYLSPSTSLKSLNILNCMVRYDNNSRIVTHAEINFRSSRFENLPGSAPLQAEALWTNNPASFYINDCSFSGLNDGVRCIGGTSPVLLQVDYSSFDRCNTGFYSSGRGLNMTGNTFSNCNVKGLYILTPANDVKVNECKFSSNNQGMEVENTGMMTRHVFVLNGLFNYNHSALELKQCYTAISCSRFLNNFSGVTAFNGELNVSRTRLNTGNMFSSAGGNNTFAYNQYGIRLSWPLLFMNDGNNNFIQNSAVMPYQFVTGEVAHSSLTHLPNSPYALRASNNHWQPAPQGSLMNGTMLHYFVMFPFPGAGLTMNYFSGSMQASVNTLCYKQACNPCEKVEKDKNGLDAGAAANEAPAMADISPYPVGNELKLDLKFRETETQFSIKLINLEGKVLLETLATQPSLVINASEWAEGMYLLEISTNERREVRKVLVRR